MCVYVCVCVFARGCVHACVLVCVYSCELVCVYSCVYMCACVCSHAPYTDKHSNCALQVDDFIVKDSDT